ncbi:hypothetical protein KIPB_011365 [Kipferlia bialata]|uniref:Pre-mRNA polyadenylation factor Fip1 domain-containing protein n=1 Tax=Kipferlia bialata TaxID=797122 RepID=A0A9K3D5J1_9EUKA|nr:hypothetical protein KIPB_011365 [Kipferlia bialata]|eukprot:g11365.t1
MGIDNPTHPRYPRMDHDLESADEKPWKKRDANIKDFFNFGFTPLTWNLYVRRQVKMRRMIQKLRQDAHPGQ